MGSAAMDGDGNLALGFSASSALINPQIRYAGRLAADPSGTLAQGEKTLFAGTGSQILVQRWGDYSDLTVDPVDDCTFWYTQEYYSALPPGPPPSSYVNWRTRIGSFSFPSCGKKPALSVDKRADANTVTAGSRIGFTVTLTNSGGADADGVSFTDPLPAGADLAWSVDAAGSDSGWSVGGSPGSQSLAFSPTSVSPGTTHVHLTTSTTGADCGTVGRTYGNTASFTGSNVGPGQASASVRVNCSSPSPPPPPPPSPPAPPPPPPAAPPPPPILLPKCVVPNVVGKSVAKARAKIVKAHCRVGAIGSKASTKKQRGVVIAQKPKSHTKLANGAKIRLTIGKGPKARRR